MEQNTTHQAIIFVTDKLRGSFWTKAFRIAIRDFQAAPYKFLLVIVAVATGVGVVTAITGFSANVKRAMLDNARQWLAADVQVRLNQLPSQAQIEAVTRRKALKTTLVTETAAMVSNPGERFQLAAIKAVDPGAYPFYGKVTLRPASTLEQLLRDDSAVVSPEVLHKLNTGVGNVIRISGADFRITGVIENEPDRFAVLPLGLMRVILSRQSFERTGILQYGSRAIHRLLISAPARIDLGPVKEDLATVFPGEEVLDYRENIVDVTGIQEQAATYLALTGLVALIAASLGAGMVMYTHVQQRMETIAILKLLGARSSQVIRIYALQTGSLGAAGGVIGLGFGLVLERLLPYLAGPYLPFHVEPVWSWSSAIPGLCAGILAPLLFSWGSLLATRAIRPYVLMRRGFESASPQEFAISSRTRWLVSFGIILGLGALAQLITGDARIAAWFAGALGAGFGLTHGAAVLTGRGLQLLLRLRPRWLPLSIRYGAANLIRPGALGPQVMIVLTLGVCFTFLAYLVGDSLASAMLQQSPFIHANLFLLNAGEQQKDGLTRSLQQMRGVNGTVELDPFLTLRLAAVNGLPFAQARNRTPSHVLRRSWFATVAQARPASLTILSGAWWGADGLASEISVSERASAMLGIGVGASLDFTDGGQRFHVRVAAVHRVKGPEALRYDLTFSPKAAQYGRLTFNGGAWVTPAELNNVEAELQRAYPAVIVMNRGELSALFQDTMAQAAAILRVISGMAVAGCAIILCASLAATRYRRELDIAILKALGATRRQVILSLFSEFFLIGTIAALLGVCLGTVAALALTSLAFDSARLNWTLQAAELTFAGTVSATVISGLAFSLTMLRKKPLEILRGE